MIASEKKMLIVGSGQAGLACAIRLYEAGARPLIFERSDGVGGRVRNDSMVTFWVGLHNSAKEQKTVVIQLPFSKKSKTDLCP